MTVPFRLSTVILCTAFLTTFQIRTSTELEVLDQTPWYGPTDTTDFYHIPAGQHINPIHGGQRYIQYRTFFSIPNVEGLPVLHQVSITYTPSDTIPPSQTGHVVALQGHSEITISWMPNTESDLSFYRVYRGPGSRDYDSLWTVAKPDTTLVDTSATTGTRYCYAVTAVDSSLNESLISDEVSATPYGIVIFVNGDAPPGGDGSYGHPFSSIQRGMDAALFGDTVFVEKGMYQENVILKPGTSLVGAGANLCEIEPRNTEPTVSCGDRSTVKGFTIHQRSDYPAVMASEVQAYICDNIIVGLGGYRPHHAIECNPRGTIAVKRNIVTGARRPMYCNDYHPGTSSLEIINNLMYDIRLGIVANNIDTLRVINNTVIIDTVASGVRSIDAIAATDNRFVNIIGNIIVNREGDEAIGIELCCGFFDPVIRIDYNDVWVTGQAFEGCQPGEGNIEVNPLFSDEQPLHFRLADGSPCRNAGPPDEIYNDLNGSRNDMGAYGGPDPLTLGLKHPSVSVSLTPVSAFAGDTIYAPVFIDNGSGLFRIEMDITSESELLTPIGARSGTLNQHFLMNTDLISTHTICLMAEGETEIPGGEGSIAYILYQVHHDAQPHRACPLRISNLKLYDGLGAQFEVRSITHGVFMVNETFESTHHIYVDQRYSGNESGTCDRPFSSISRAIEAASSGDTILVAAGFYQEHIRMKDRTSLRGSGSLVTTIDFERFTSDEPGETVLFENVTSGEISNIEISIHGQNTLPAAIRCVRSSVFIHDNRILAAADGWAGGILCDSSSVVTIENNAIITETGGGMAIGCFSSMADVKGNAVDVLEGGTGVYLSSSEASILRNNVALYGPAESALHTTASPVLIANNCIGGSEQSRGINARSTDSLIIVNNVICRNRTGIHLYEVDGTVIKNNIIFEHDTPMGRGILCKSGCNAVVSYNTFWENDVDCEFIIRGEGNIYKDPSFVDRENQDFHLRSHSPCIDSGDPDPAGNDTDGTRNDTGLYGGPHAPTKDGPFHPPVEFVLSDTTAAPGDTTEMSIQLDNAYKISEVGLLFSYSPDALFIMDFWTTEYSRSFLLTVEDVAPGQMRVSLKGPHGIKAVHYPISRLRICVSRFVSEGTRVKIKVNQVAVRDDLNIPLPVGHISDGVIDIEAKTEVEPEDRSPQVPQQYILFQNFPNPFNPSTDIRYQIGDCRLPMHTTLKVYNILGQEIRTLVDEITEPGYYTVRWDGKDQLGGEAASGIYFFQLKAGSYIHTKKMMLLR